LKVSASLKLRRTRAAIFIEKAFHNCERLFYFPYFINVLLSYLYQHA
jgi:hypothetical protein